MDRITHSVRCSTRYRGPLVPGQMPRILIADDSERVRLLLRDIVASCGYQVCGEVANGREAVLQTASLIPDVIIVDLSMPDLNGIEAGKVIASRAPDVKMILCTAEAIDDEIVREAQNIGFHGIVGKGQAELLPCVINIVLQGGVVFVRDERPETRNRPKVYRPRR